jgi:hypothetical protein
LALVGHGLGDGIDVVFPKYGNLTLLTQELNSSISNGPFKEKSKAIAKDSDLRLNAWLRPAPIEMWSETFITVRGEELLNTNPHNG